MNYGVAVHADAIVRPGEPADNGSIADTEEHAHRAYDVQTYALVLVRPDGYIGWMTESHSARCIQDYLHDLVSPMNMG